MPKTQKKLLLLSSFFLALGMLSACNNQKPSDVSQSEPTPDSETESQSEESISQSESESEPSTESESETEQDDFIDYAHNGSCTLSLEYSGHDFFVDGIGEVSLKTHIDGDTAHFYPVVGHTETILKARFYGIDTPESTGSVQKWGKQASNFTKEKLLNAKENGTIVISSPAHDYQAPEADSTGGRYLSLVWINETVKHAPLDQLVLLNLWIVQEGFSWAKNVSAVPEFVDTFYAAQSQAEKYKLNLWSEEDPPGWIDGDYEPVSLLDIKREIAKNIADASYVNAYNNKKVRFTGVVSGYANNTLYVQEYCYNFIEVEDDEGNITTEIDPTNPGEYAGINIFTGMTAISSRFTTIGTYIEVVGRCIDSELFGFQITDTVGHWSIGDSDNPDDCKVILDAEDNIEEHALYTFDKTSTEINNMIKSNDLENLYCRTNVTDPLVCRRAFVGDDSSITLYFNNCDFNVYIPFQYTGDLNNKSDIWSTEDRFIGKTFQISGTYSWRRTSAGKVTYQLVPSSSQDIICQNDQGTLPGDRFSVSDAYDFAASMRNGATTTITYYFSAKISSISKLESGKYNIVVSDDERSITLNDATVSEAAEANAKVGSVIYFKGTIKKNSTTDIEVVAAIVSNSYPHGCLIDDPLTVLEAIDAINALPSQPTEEDGNANHPAIRYYVSGTIKSIEVPLTGNKTSFTITDGTNDLRVVDSRIRPALDVTEYVVGAKIIVSGRLYHNGESLSLEGACYIESFMK